MGIYQGKWLEVLSNQKISTYREETWQGALASSQVDQERGRQQGCWWGCGYNWDIVYWRKYALNVDGLTQGS